MTCKSFSAMIPAFLEDTLEDKPLMEFLEHYEKCRNCQEELEIQFLVDRAFTQIRQGADVNLSEDLPNFIEEARRKAERRVRLSNFAYGMEICAVVLAVATVVMYLV